MTWWITNPKGTAGLVRAMQRTLWFWKGNPLQDSVCQQVSHSAPCRPPRHQHSRAHKPAVLPLKLHDNMSAAELEVMMEGVLDRKFLQWKKDIVTDLMGMVTPIIEALEGDIFELREENKILKERFDKQVRDREKQVERENIAMFQPKCAQLKMNNMPGDITCSVQDSRIQKRQCWD